MGTMYTIQRGDNLSKLARRFGLGSWREIYRHPRNARFRDGHPNANLIYPGEQLYIPDPREVPARGRRTRNPTSSTSPADVRLPPVHVRRSDSRVIEVSPFDIQGTVRVQRIVQRQFQQLERQEVPNYTDPSDALNRVTTSLSGLLSDWYSGAIDRPVPGGERDWARRYEYVDRAYRVNRIDILIAFRVVSQTIAIEMLRPETRLYVTTSTVSYTWGEPESVVAVNQLRTVDLTGIHGMSEHPIARFREHRTLTRAQADGSPFSNPALIAANEG